MRKSFLKKQQQSGEMALQITSMADIFMILLVFLLKSFSTSINNLAPTMRMELPVAAKSSEEVKDLVKMEVSSSGIMIDQKPVVTLVNFEFPPGEVSEAGRNEKIYSVLFEERKRQPIPNMDSKLLLMADENTPYATLKTLIGSAAAAGFVDLQLVTSEAE